MDGKCYYQSEYRSVTFNYGFVELMNSKTDASCANYLLYLWLLWFLELSTYSCSVPLECRMGALGLMRFFSSQLMGV